MSDQPTAAPVDNSWWDKFCYIRRGSDKGKMKGFVKPEDALKMSAENRRRCCA